MSSPKREGKLRELLKKTTSAPSLEELLTHIVAELGGVVPAARLIASEITSAKKNSLTRTRLLEGLMRGFKSNDVNRQGPRDYALMSDEDLEGLMLDNMTKLHARRQAEETLAEQKATEEPVEDHGDAGGDTRQAETPSETPADPGDQAS